MTTAYDMTGGLWDNRSKNPKAPTYLGTVTIKGVKYKLAAWETRYDERAKGLPTLRITVTEPDMQHTGGTAPQAKGHQPWPININDGLDGFDPDDDIPF